jgi:anti-sigma regulatory factor (Ser/Thr protein kinase)
MLDLPSATGPALSEAGELLVRIRVPANADRLKLVRGCSESAALMCGFTPTAARDVCLAVDEACQNIIRHVYGHDGGGEMVLELRRLPDGLGVYLRDYGAMTDPSRVRPRDLDTVRPGGLGTHFIHSVMDRVTFLPPSDGRGNLLELIKYFEPGGRSHG